MNKRVMAMCLMCGLAMVAGCDWVSSLTKSSRVEAPPSSASAGSAAAPPVKRPSVDESQVLAWVQDRPITIDDFKQHRDAAVRMAEEAIKNAPQGSNNAELLNKLKSEATTPEAKQGFLKQLVREELLYQDALARNLDQDPEVQQVLRNAQRNVLLQKARQRLLDQVTSTVNADAVAKFYETNKAYFKEPDRLQLRVMVVATEEEAKGLLSQLYGGADFVELARQHSLHESKERGGSWGPIIRAQDYELQKTQGAAPAGEVAFSALEALVFAEGVKEGNFTAPVQGPDGRWWIAMVVSRETGRQKQLVEVQDAISEWLKSQAYQQAFEQYVNELESRATSEGHLTVRESALEQVQ